ncbi:MAG: NYN domain-containing protein [Gemmataceae bacterium]
MDSYLESVMRYLIDGYNLAHASGDLRGKVGPHGLERARLALVARVAAGHDSPGDVTVVFDARHAAGDKPSEENIQGIHVHYAVREEADDLIERLIRSDATPKKLTVVSSDRRLKDAARRRGCIAMTSGEYLDWLDRPRTVVPTPEPPEKPEATTPEDAVQWLEAFQAKRGKPNK